MVKKGNGNSESDNIQVPMYQAIVPNQVYGKRSEITSMDDPNEKIYDVLLISRFTQPTKENILDNLKMYAQNILLKKETKCTFTEVLRTIEPEMIKEYAKEESAHRDILRNYIPPTHLFDGKEYIQIQSAIIPLKHLLQAKKEDFQTDYEKYLHTLASNGENHARIQILLREGKMPAQKAIENYLDDRVKISSAFATSIPFEEYYLVREQVELLYLAIKPEEKIKLVPDQTKEITEEMIARTRVAQLESDLQQRMHREGMEALLRQFQGNDEPDDNKDTFN